MTPHILFAGIAGSVLGVLLVAGSSWSACAADAFPDITQLPAHPGLPDPLVMLNGDKVTTKEQWMQKRRPELKALFQQYMYGHMPEAHVEFQLGRMDKKALGGKATQKEITGVLHSPEGPKMHLLLLVPNNRLGPAPVFVGLNFCGNQTVRSDPSAPLPESWMPNSCAGCMNNRATDASRGTQVATWDLEQSIDRGYAVALFYNGDVEGDRPNAPDGVRAAYPAYDWGAIAAWAWGLSRAVDYLVTDPDIV